MTAILHQIIEMFKDFFAEIGPAIDRALVKIAQSLFSFLFRQEEQTENIRKEVERNDCNTQSNY